MANFDNKATVTIGNIKEIVKANPEEQATAQLSKIKIGVDEESTVYDIVDNINKSAYIIDVTDSINAPFNSTADSIVATQLKTTDGVVVSTSEMKLGIVVKVVNKGIPNRWYAGSDVFYLDKSMDGYATEDYVQDYVQTYNTEHNQVIAINTSDSHNSMFATMNDEVSFAGSETSMSILDVNGVVYALRDLQLGTIVYPVNYVPGREEYGERYPARLLAKNEVTGVLTFYRVQSKINVKDVKVNGSSVIDDEGVANITTSNFATKEEVNKVEKEVNKVKEDKQDKSTLDADVGDCGYSKVEANPSDMPYFELEKIKINDTIYSVSGGSSSISWGSITGNLSNQTDLKTELDLLDVRVSATEHDKQDRLTAGKNITIDQSTNTISATGEPDAYIKNASVSGNTLTLTKKDGNTVGFTPAGEGGITDVQVDDTSVVEEGVAHIDLTGKQDKLIEGTNITIVDNVISATNSGTSDYNELDNKPQIEGHTLSGDSSASTLGLATITQLNTKLDSTKCTYQTTAPTSAISDGGVHIVFLSSEPTTKYNGYIYLISE